MKTIAIAATIMTVGTWAVGVHAAQVDHALFASLLSRHVKDGVVDYKGFQDVIGYFIKFADAPLSDRLVNDKGRIKVKFLDYDWSLNGT